MPKRYKSKYTGNVYSTREEAIKDNSEYLKDPLNRFAVKSENYPKYKELTIPFIEQKRRTLSNAGHATGAIISENLLDSIAKYAEIEGLPIKTALGLAVKESTLGNPTDNKDVYKLTGDTEGIKYARTKQYLNKHGNDINARHLVNYFKDDWNPYEEAIKIAKVKSLGSNTYFYKPSPNMWGNINNPGYLEALKKYDKQKAIIDSVLLAGERYADKQAEKKKKNITGIVLQAAFRDYKNNPNNYNPGQPNYVQLVDKRAEEVWGSPEVQSWYRRRLENAGRSDVKAYGGSIHIAPSKRGTFTAAATKHGMSVQAFANQVLKNKDRYSPAMVKKANFAKNASKWN